MSPIPGIDDDNEKEGCCDGPVLPFSRQKRLREEESETGQGKRLRLCDDTDNEDRELYGRSSDDNPQSLVSGMTLVTEKLPMNEIAFLSRLLSASDFTELEMQRLSQLMTVLKKLQRIDDVNVFQVAFITSLWTEAARRQQSVRSRRYKDYYPYLKTRSPSLMQLQCFCIGPVNKPISPSYGHLVSVRIVPNQWPIETPVIPYECFAYVSESGRRPPDRSLRLEAEVLKRLSLDRKEITVQELVIQLPFSAELFHSPNFHLSVAPICRISDLLMQSRAVYDIGANPLFRYFQTKNFSLLTTGVPISSDASRFSCSQLEAVQRAFDLVMQPVVEKGNPCKAVFTDGEPELVRQTTIEILVQLLTSESTRNQQFVVVSSQKSLCKLFSLMKEQMHRLGLQSKLIFVTGCEDSKIRSFAKFFLEREIETLTPVAHSADEEPIAPMSEKSTAKLQHMKNCKPLFSLESQNAANITPEMQETADEFLHHALLYALRSARLLFASVREISKSPDVYNYLKSEKVHALEQQIATDVRQKNALSASIIVDADSVTDPELMSLEKDFSFRRFILSSAWFSSQELDPDHKSMDQTASHVDHKMSHRLRDSTAACDPPLIVKVESDL